MKTELITCEIIPNTTLWVEKSLQNKKLQLGYWSNTDLGCERTICKWKIKNLKHETNTNRPLQ